VLLLAYLKELAEEFLGLEAAASLACLLFSDLINLREVCYLLSLMSAG